MKIDVYLSLSVVSVLVAGVAPELNASETYYERGRIEVAEFNKDEQLVRPTNIDEWIFLGASVGHGYPAEGGGEFSLKNPGLIQIVQIEPKAYNYFKKNKHYADGTMLALSFYNTQDKPSPAVDGLVQADLETFEIHLLDKARLNDERAFYLFRGDSNVAGMIPEGNNCVSCHVEEAHFDGTFTDFYPLARDSVLDGS